MSGLDLVIWQSQKSQTKVLRCVRNMNHTHLLLDTLVVTAVTEAREMASGSASPARNMLCRSKFSVSRIAGSSERPKKNKSHWSERFPNCVYNCLWHFHEPTWLIWSCVTHPCYWYLHSCPCVRGVYCASWSQILLCERNLKTLTAGQKVPLCTTWFMNISAEPVAS